MNIPPIKYREAIYADWIRKDPCDPTSFMLPVAPPVFVGWHYWGWIDGDWEGPDSLLLENSYPYVGLKDKHSIEIYVGDIIKYVNHGADHIPVLVIWQNDYLQFCVEEIWSNSPVHGDLWDSEFIREKSRVKTNVRVLGNVVEHQKYKEIFKPKRLPK